MVGAGGVRTREDDGEDGYTGFPREGEDGMSKKLHHHRHVCFVLKYFNSYLKILKLYLETPKLY